MAVAHKGSGTIGMVIRATNSGPQEKALRLCDRARANGPFTYEAGHICIYMKIGILLGILVVKPTF